MRHFHSFSIALLFSSNVLAQGIPGLLGIPSSSVPVVPSVVSQVGGVVNGVVSVTPTGRDTANNARQSTSPVARIRTNQNGAGSSSSPQATNHPLAQVVSTAAHVVGSVATQDTPSVAATVKNTVASVVHGVQSIGEYRLGDQLLVWPAPVQKSGSLLDEDIC